MTATETRARADLAPASVRPGLILATAALVQFLISLDLAIVDVALPRIGAGLGFRGAGLTWVVNAYTLTFGGLLLLGGKAADRYGPGRILRFGLALFGLASFAGGLAQTSGQLIAARAVQGVGAAALAPAALSLLTAAFPGGRARVRAFGVWSAVNAAGGAFGVLAGGLLTEYVGWRWVMFVNVPMVAAASVLALRGDAGVRRSVDRGGRPDVLGAVLVTAGLTLLTFGVVRTDQHGWTSTVTVATLAIAAALLVAFVHVERTTVREPLLRLGLLANRVVAGANAYNLVLGGVMTSGFYLVCLYLQRALREGPAATGAMFLPFALGIVAGSVVAVQLADRVAPRTLLIAGALLAAAGFGWFAFISPHGSYLVDVLGPELPASFGYGLCLAPVVSIATIGVAAHEAGTASALLNSSRQVGGSLGLAVLGTIAANRAGSATTAPALTGGYALGLALDCGLMVAAAGIAVLVLRSVGFGPSDGRARPFR